MAITYVQGLPDEQRANAAQLYDEAFGAKLSKAIGNESQRVALLAAAFVSEYAFCALQDGQIVGLAGFQTAQGSLTSAIGYRTLLAHLGFWGGNWAAVVLSLFERHPAQGQLLMDGIAVRQEMRGHGVGTQLLTELTRYAAAHGYATIRLDVIDVNPGARKLYERFGFKAGKTEHFGFLRGWLGFGASTTMELDVADKVQQGL